MPSPFINTCVCYFGSSLCEELILDVTSISRGASSGILQRVVYSGMADVSQVKLRNYLSIHSPQWFEIHKDSLLRGLKTLNEQEENRRSETSSLNTLVFVNLFPAYRGSSSEAIVE